MITSFVTDKLLNLNVRKTKMMNFDKRDEHKHEVKVNGVAIEEVESFKYLGSVKTRFGDCSKDITTRIAITKRKTLELTDIWKSGQIDKTVENKIGEDPNMTHHLLWSSGFAIVHCERKEAHGSRTVDIQTHAPCQLEGKKNKREHL